MGQFYVSWNDPVWPAKADSGASLVSKSVAGRPRGGAQPGRATCRETGGYLLTACFATGRAAGLGVRRWLAAGAWHTPRPS